MEGDRDRRRDDRDSDFRGETYRPAAGRSPPPRDDYRPRGPPAVDTYVPSSSRASRPRSRSRERYRGRSRSPIGSYRGRPRSPPLRRGFSPRRSDPRYNERPRSPPPRGYIRQDDRYSERSPRRYRERSPLKRSREVSPTSNRGMRSPPPPKRERLASPPRRERYDDYRPSTTRREHTSPRDSRRSPPPPRSHRDRSRTPPYRSERANLQTADEWRRRSPSPRAGRERVSGDGSATTSRRSSPPIHPSRTTLQAEPEPPASRARSPHPPRSPARRRESSPPGDYNNNGDRRTSLPYRTNEVPKGPASSRPHSGIPPSGPSSSFPAPASTYAHPSGTSVLAAPSHPRGSRGGYRGAFPSRGYPPREPFGRGRGRGRGRFDDDEDSPAPGQGPYRGRGSGAYQTYNSLGQSASHSYRAGPAFPSFRGNSSSSTTYPRTQRFNIGPEASGEPTPTGAEKYLADLPKIIPGGQRLPDTYDQSKIRRLEEETRKLKESIVEKETKARQSLAEWDKLQRESDIAKTRAEQAETSLRIISGDDNDGGTAF
ncbi:MAG: hypothetical protein M1820_008624 [Bogoriella megaspora]|nr:MAG: hypothetical protein M1820_008624 [Bogoriella megaspora]